MARTELDVFFATWEREAEATLTLLRALPADQYDFRPDATGRSLGELAWHLAEGDASMSFGIERGGFSLQQVQARQPSSAAAQASTLRGACAASAPPTPSAPRYPLALRLRRAEPQWRRPRRVPTA